MPIEPHCCFVRYIKTWQDMKRWQRKAFHRENELRAMRGLPPKEKPYYGEPNQLQAEM